MKKRNYIYCILTLVYILGSHNGYIALWKGENTEPIKVFPFRVSGLPEKDRAALEKGIRIEQTDELNRMLEDYLS